MVKCKIISATHAKHDWNIICKYFKMSAHTFAGHRIGIPADDDGGGVGGIILYSGGKQWFYIKTFGQFPF